jgi:hypothetical protein
VDWLLRRRDVLREVLHAHLNQNAFRNVLRQAQYDCGGVCLALGKLVLQLGTAGELDGPVLQRFQEASSRDKSEPEQRMTSTAASSSSTTATTTTTTITPPFLAQLLLQEGCECFKGFVAAFDAELAQTAAIQKTVADLFEPSDYAGYVLGLMQLSLALLVLSNGQQDSADREATRSQSVACLTKCRLFLSTHAKVLQEQYPEALAYDAQCVELLALLTGSTPSIGGRDTLQVVQAKHVDTLAALPLPAPRLLPSSGKRIMIKK